MQTKYGRAKCTASPQTKTKIKHWQELLKQSNTTPPAQQFIFLKWNKTFCKAICPQEGPKAQVFILKNEPVLEINKCKRKALHTVLLKENLHLHNSKPLVSAKQMNFRLRPRSLFFLYVFGWVTKISEWSCKMEMLTHPKPQLLVLLFFFPSGSNKSIPHQKAGGAVQVPSLFRHAGDARRPTARNRQAARPDTLPALSTLHCHQRGFFHATPSSFFQELPPSSTFQKWLPSPWCTTRLSSPDDFNLDEAFCALAEQATFFLSDLKRFLPV